MKAPFYDGHTFLVVGSLTCNYQALAGKRACRAKTRKIVIGNRPARNSFEGMSRQRKFANGGRVVVLCHILRLFFGAGWNQQP
jgi:hypothetical protein